MTSTPNPRPTWHQKYAEELATFSALAEALGGDDPIGAVARQAMLSEAETKVLRLWTAGQSHHSIALALGKRHIRPAQDLGLRGKYKILLWLVRFWLYRVSPQHE